jgi:hypothetical protein
MNYTVRSDMTLSRCMEDFRANFRELFQNCATDTAENHELA